MILILLCRILPHSTPRRPERRIGWVHRVLEKTDEAGGKTMTRFRMSILFRLSQLLAWVLVVALITSTLTATLFDPRPYLNAMKERNFYLALQGTVGALADKGFEGVPDQERAKIVTAVTESLSVQWIEEQVTMSLEAFLGFVQGRSDQFEARISLSEPKRTLAEKVKADLPTAARKRVANDLQQLPDEYNLASGSIGETAVSLRGGAGSLARFPKLALGGAAVLVLFIWLLTGRKAMALGWIGDGLLFGGLIAIVFSLILPLPAGMLPKPTGPLELLPVKEVLGDVLSAAGANVRKASLFVSGAGLLLIFVDRFLEGRSRKASFAQQ